MARGKTGGSALKFFGQRGAWTALVALGLLCFLGAQASAEPQPSSLKLECVQAGRVLPEVLAAKMLHPGHKTGLTQTVYIKAAYPAMPEACAGAYRRLGQVKPQIRVHGKWRSMVAYWSTIYSRDRQGVGGLGASPTGHEGNWIWWKPGEPVRAVFRNVVKNLRTRKVEGQKTKTIPVQVFGGSAQGRAASTNLRSTVSWSLPSEVNEGAGIPISWRASRVGSGHLVVQRQVGTAHAWQTTARLKSKRGSAELPSLTLGEYRLRIAVLSNKRRVLAQLVGSIGVFGQVPLGELFKHGVVGVHTLPTATFPYVHDAVGSFTVEHNHCNAMHIEFVPTGYHLTAGTVTVLQETRDPVSATTPADTIGTLDVALVPGQAWTLRPEPVRH